MIEKAKKNLDSVLSHRVKIALALVFISLFIGSQLQAQVKNDNIESRSLLIADSITISSNTSNASVEWQCVNRSLTKKCLVYHNDQWFYFTVPDKRKYFLNIYGQACRDARGLQLILIEGNPCQVDTYKIIQCIDKIPQDDLFISLDSLKKDVQYLVNIDGFLNDYCDFNIQLSTHPIGFPYQMIVEDVAPTSLFLSDSVVNIQIDANAGELDQVKNVEVFRSYSSDSHAVKTRAGIIKLIPIERNAIGSAVTTYNFYDTLHDRGLYQYKLVCENEKGDRKLFLNKSIRFRKYNHATMLQPQQDSFIRIPIESRKRASFDIYVYDLLTNKLLLYKMIAVEKRSEEMISLGVTRYVEEGVHNFLVKIVNQKTPDVKLFKFVMDETGNIVSRE